MEFRAALGVVRQPQRLEAGTYKPRLSRLLFDTIRIESPQRYKFFL